MQTRLDGKTALVLGGSKGLGLGVAEALSARGAATLLVGRDEKALRDASELIESRGEGACATFAADLASEEGVETLLSHLETSAPAIDILLLNGGGPPPFAASSFEPLIWRQQFDSMFLNQIRLFAEKVLPALFRETRLKGVGITRIVDQSAAGQVHDGSVLLGIWILSESPSGAQLLGVGFIVAAHMGSNEAVAASVADRGYPVSVIADDSSFPELFDICDRLCVGEA